MRFYKSTRITDKLFQPKSFTNIFYKIIPLSHRIDLFFAKGSEANNQARVTFSNKIA